MKKLVYKILLFLLPLFVGIILIPVDKRLIYKNLDNDCFNHGIWIYDRIFNNEKEINIVFLGSSHTINGINDQLISEELNENAVNMGYCRLGRNLHYILLKEIFSVKKTRKVVLEVRESEDWSSHPVFPHIASDKDVFFTPLLFNLDYISDLWVHLTYKLEILQKEIYLGSNTDNFKMQEYGFATKSDTASVEFLDQIKMKRQKPKHQYSEIELDFHNSFPRAYLRKIFELCTEMDAELYFLYMPSYGKIYSNPTEIGTYQQYGKLLMPPADIFEDKNNWFDENHLNEAGAKKLSLWISGKMKVE